MPKIEDVATRDDKTLFYPVEVLERAAEKGDAGRYSSGVVFPGLAGEKVWFLTDLTADEFIGAYGLPVERSVDRKPREVPEPVEPDEPQDVPEPDEPEDPEGPVRKEGTIFSGAFDILAAVEAFNEENPAFRVSLLVEPK